MTKKKKKAPPSKHYNKLTEADEKELADLKEMIALHHGIRVDELTSMRSFAYLVHARRRFAIEAIKRGYSLKTIGRHLGGRHHTTILTLARGSNVSVTTEQRDRGTTF